MIEEIRELVRESCLAETNIHGYGAWSHHILVVVKYAKELAKKLAADEEVVEIAALLHDYAGIINGEWQEEHHIHGARLAKELLARYNYPKDKANVIAQCIETHRASKLLPKQTIEAKIIASADAISHIMMAYEVLHYTYAVKKMTVDEGAVWTLKKIERSWKKMMPEAKDMVREQYKAARKFLSPAKDHNLPYATNLPPSVILGLDPGICETSQS